MIFRAGQKCVKVPPIGMLEHVVLKVDGTYWALNIVPMEEIQKERKRLTTQRAWPMMAALARGQNEVHFWPTPHKKGELKIVFYPPVQEV